MFNDIYKMTYVQQHIRSNKHRVTYVDLYNYVHIVTCRMTFVDLQNYIHIVTCRAMYVNCINKVTYIKYYIYNDVYIK